MARKIQTIDDYKQVSADVWTVFKKYFPADADTTDFTDDVHKLDLKYKPEFTDNVHELDLKCKPEFTEDVHKLDLKYTPELRQYCFMRQLLKVYFDELNELKGVRNVKTD